MNAKLWGIALLLGLCGIASAQPSPIVFEQAEFVLSDATLPPGDDATWTPVTLPDDWRRTRPGVTGTGWYRIKLQLETKPLRNRGIYMPHRRAQSLAFFANGVMFGSLEKIPEGSSDFGLPLFFPFPAPLLRSGENVLHARIRASPELQHGLSRVTFGDSAQINALFNMDLERSAYAARHFAAAALVAGLIALFLWFARRADAVMLWFSVACLAWGSAMMSVMYTRFFDIGELRHAVTFLWRFGLVTPALVLCLRTVGLKAPRFEVTVWAIFALGLLSSMATWAAAITAHRLAASLVYSALPLVAIGILWRWAPRPLGWSHRLEAGALLLMAALNFREAMRIFGWMDVDGALIITWHVPILLLALSVAIFERHVAAIRETEEAKRTLERRVEEKAREIEAFHARTDETSKEQARAAERERILADMHDGIGASLIALLRHVQSGAADRAAIERRVHETLQELRIAIDSLEPCHDDLATVLGSMRYRLEDMIRGAGIRLVWQVEELPPVDALEPATVFSLQRILLEAVGNALKHSRGSELRISARTLDEHCLSIDIEDDGRGFDASLPAAGHGLANMRARAERIGARLEVGAAATGGTSVRIILRQRLPATISEAQASPAALSAEPVLSARTA
jgi:signal transduction histidine kinase